MKKEEYITILNKIETRANEPEIKKIDNYVKKLKKEYQDFMSLDAECNKIIDKMNTAEFKQEELDSITSELNKKGFYKSIAVERAIYKDCFYKASYNYMTYVLQDLFKDFSNDVNKIIEFIEYDKSKRGQHWLEYHFISLVYDYSKYIKCSYYFNTWSYSESYYLYLSHTRNIKPIEFELLTLKQVGALLKQLEEENNKIQKQLKSIYENIVSKNSLYGLTDSNSFSYSRRLKNFY